MTMDTADFGTLLRLDDEPEHAFRAFTQYAAMPARSRSIRRLSAMNGWGTTTLSKWSTQYRWQQRVGTLDTYTRHQAQHTVTAAWEHADEYRNNVRRLAEQAATIALQYAMQALSQPVRATATDAARLLQAASTLAEAFDLTKDMSDGRGDVTVEVIYSTMEAASNGTETT